MDTLVRLPQSQRPIVLFPVIKDPITSLLYLLLQSFSFKLLLAKWLSVNMRLFLPVTQLRFTKGLSTIGTFRMLVHGTRSSLDMKQESRLILLNLSEAFNTVPLKVSVILTDY